MNPQKSHAADIYISGLRSIKEGYGQVNVSRSKHYYKSKKDTRKDSAILEAIKAIATDFHSYGYRRITVALKREGIAVNYKKVYRIHKMHFM